MNDKNDVRTLGDGSVKRALGALKTGIRAGKYGLELDNVRAGWVSEVDGGHAVADVVTERTG
jgi:hypothetical protein